MPVIIISYYKQLLLLLLQSSLSIQGWGAVPGTIPPRKAKSKVAQVNGRVFAYIKWQSICIQHACILSMTSFKPSLDYPIALYTM